MTRSDALEAFARAYARRMPEDEAPIVDGDQLDAEIVGAFDFLDDRRREPLSIRVFDPTVEHDGYAAPGSVVEIVIDDMPFLIDSITSRLAALGHTIVRHYHPVVGTTRDASGALTEVGPGRDAEHRESVQHYELAETLPPSEGTALETELRATLEEVASTVRDFEPMRFAVRRMAHYVFEDGSVFDRADVDEAIAFLEWLLDDNFILLGYREYDIEDDGNGPSIVVNPESGFGILSDPSRSRFADPVSLASLAPDLRDSDWNSRQLVISKNNPRSTNHREARMD
jgi:glutamate dehydrogenase